jgi:tRNA U34 5-carboxymethylaminomethyl modifying enzyme MnmG/GidA
MILDRQPSYETWKTTADRVAAINRDRQIEEWIDLLLLRRTAKMNVLIPRMVESERKYPYRIISRKVCH